ncbi:MAG: hypothetical protein GY953_32380, partial [bacterium]|nr:hypothetical protein [bacterium]
MESHLIHPNPAIEESVGGKFLAPAATIRLLKWMALAGAVTLVAGSLLAPERTWANLLLASFYLLGLGLAGVVFVALQYVTGAEWSVAFRRVPEAMAGTLPYAAGIFLLVLMVSPWLYPWFHGLHGEPDPSMWFKELWLSPVFFIVRALVYLAVWLGFAHAIVRTSRRQDDDGKPGHTVRNIRLSAGFLVAFALTFWLATFDWIMSLEPHWYSTVFAVYHFAGLVLSGLAMITIVAVWLQRLGTLRGILTVEHLHDLGKLLFAFSCFWMYIWFCQYMLIWYGNIPEETVYYVQREHGAWHVLSIANPIVNWLIPFLILLPRPAKR